MSAGTGLLVANGASTFALTGLIWTIQLVHYPTFRYVSASRFVAFETFHQRRISYVVVPLMLIELGTAMALIFFLPPSIPLWWAAAGATLTLVIWASTFAVQVPLHRRLSQGFDHGAVERLIQTNWLRTAAWSIRATLLLWGLWSLV